MMRTGIALSFLVWGLVLSSCVSHIAPYKPKKRRYVVGTYSTKKAPKERGSLWVPGSRGYFEDARASRVGDTIMVKIDESTDASRSASTALNKKSSTSAGMGTLLGLLTKLAAKYPDLNLASLVSGSFTSELAADGNTVRKGTLQASIAVRIAKIMPNGDFYVEGHKVVLLNNEENHLYISGVVRPADVNSDNAVYSYRIADAQVEFSGRGELSDNQKQGWFSRFLSKIWPF